MLERGPKVRMRNGLRKPPLRPTMTNCAARPTSQAVVLGPVQATGDPSAARTGTARCLKTRFRNQLVKSTTAMATVRQSEYPARQSKVTKRMERMA